MVFTKKDSTKVDLDICREWCDCFMSHASPARAMRLYKHGGRQWRIQKFTLRLVPNVSGGPSSVAGLECEFCANFWEVG